jgi:ribonuclease P protein component
VRIGRVRTRAGFAALAATGRRARSGLVRVTAVLGDPPDRVEAAFAIGRAVGPAVVRNRVRRRLRAALAELGPASGRYLIGVTPEAAAVGYARLRADLAAALERAGARPCGARG